MRALIDCDILVYRCGFAAEKADYHIYLHGQYGEAVHVEHLKKDATKWIKDRPEEEYSIHREVTVEPVAHALHLVNNMIKTALEITRSDSYECYLTGVDNYRDKVATIRKYKDRPDRKPVHYGAIQEFLVKRWGAKIVDGYEADDALSMEQWQSREYDDTVICSIDKDLRMIPGYHYHFVDQDMVCVDETEAYRNFFKQMIKGDDTDTIPGIFKLTGETCKKGVLEELNHIDDPHGMEAYVKDVYYTACGEDLAYWKYLDFTALPEIARLLWMSRERPDDCPFFQP